MTSMKLRRSIVTACAVLATTIVVACGKSDDTTTTTTPDATPSTPLGASPSSTPGAARVIDIAVAGGKIITASSRPVIKRGETVELRVTTDVDDEVHLHGYDNSVDVTAAKPATLDFVADVSGVFEVELEHSGKKLLELEVHD